MPTPPPEVLAPAAAALRRAVELIECATPGAFANDVKEIKRRIGWILAGLNTTATCTRCGQPFTVNDAVVRARERMPAPQTCPACRRRR